LIHSGDIRDQTLKLFKVARTVDFGWVNIYIYNFIVSGPKFTRYKFADKFKSCPKSRRILHVFALPNFKGGGDPQMLYIRDNAPFMARHVAKFHGITSPNPKVIGANTLNYKPIFDPPFEKIVRGTLVSGGVWASKT